jgi:uncharacterized protein (TIGR01244 family)
VEAGFRIVDPAVTLCSHLEETALMKPSIYLRTVKCAIFACVGLALASGAAYAGNETAAHAKITSLADRFSVSGQIGPDQLADLKARGYTTIISLRPVGEGSDQASLVKISDAARGIGMAFAYVPVASGAIQDASVAALSQAVTLNSGKVLLYCRSGSRAARTWSLFEASRPGGSDADFILATVKASGQSADDLRAAIVERISARPTKKQ